MEQESKNKFAEAIKGNRENIAKITLDVFKGFLTCGLYFAPAIVKNFKLALENNSEIPTINCSEVEFIDEDNSKSIIEENNEENPQIDFIKIRNVIYCDVY